MISSIDCNTVRQNRDEEWLVLQASPCSLALRLAADVLIFPFLAPVALIWIKTELINTA